MDRDQKAKLLLILYLSVCGIGIIAGIILFIFFQPERCHDGYGAVIECTPKP